MNFEFPNEFNHSFLNDLILPFHNSPGIIYSMWYLNTPPHTSNMLLIYRIANYLDFLFSFSFLNGSPSFLLPTSNSSPDILYYLPYMAFNYTTTYLLYAFDIKDCELSRFLFNVSFLNGSPSFLLPTSNVKLLAPHYLPYVAYNTPPHTSYLLLI